VFVFVLFFAVLVLVTFG